jgi:hypothetical protein
MMGAWRAVDEQITLRAGGEVTNAGQLRTLA